MNKILVLFSVLLVFACSSEVEKGKKIEEDLKALPKLSPIEIPEGVVGTYVGNLPCDECDVRRVKMTLDSAGRASIEEIFVSGTQDTVKSSAAYKDSSGFIVVRFDDGKRFFSFQKNKGTSLLYLREGKVYLDETEEPYQLLRLLNAGKR